MKVCNIGWGQQRVQDSLSFIKEKGATLIAISPEKLENISKTIGKTKVSYAVLLDDSLKIMKSYDVAFNLDSSIVDKYKNLENRLISRRSIYYYRIIYEFGAQ